MYTNKKPIKNFKIKFLLSNSIKKKKNYLNITLQKKPKLLYVKSPSYSSNFFQKNVDFSKLMINNSPRIIINSIQIKNKVNTINVKNYNYSNISEKQSNLKNLKIQDIPTNNRNIDHLKTILKNEDRDESQLLLNKNQVSKKILMIQKIS